MLIVPSNKISSQVRYAPPQGLMFVHLYHETEVVLVGFFNASPGRLIYIKRSFSLRSSSVMIYQAERWWWPSIPITITKIKCKIPVYFLPLRAQLCHISFSFFRSVGFSLCV